MVYDVGIIGGGLVGLATAWQILCHRPRWSVIVLEAEPAPAMHQSGRNSGVIHSGIYYRPGSLKARLCVSGREALIRFCTESGIPFRTTGKLIVARRTREIRILEMLLARGRANGLYGLRMVSASEIRDLEPHVTAAAGLFVPQTAIVDFRQVANHLVERIQAQGGVVRTGFRVASVRGHTDSLELRSADDAVTVRYGVNCAGLHADRIAQRAGATLSVQIIPFRGEFYALTPVWSARIRHPVYPVPDPTLPFLGIHLTPSPDGVCRVGPNAVLALCREGYHWRDICPRDCMTMLTFPGFWRMLLRHARFGVREVIRSLCRRCLVNALRTFLPEVTVRDIRPDRAGVRAQAVDRSGRLIDDFVIVRSPRMVHVVNAPSPAATACLAIGQWIAERITREL